jgi:Resolvase, N terminal domain
MTETHPQKRPIGYGRVSTYGQTLDSQLDQLRTAGCSSRNIHREKVTGARADLLASSSASFSMARGDKVAEMTKLVRADRQLLELFASRGQAIAAYRAAKAKYGVK